MSSRLRLLSLLRSGRLAPAPAPAGRLAGAPPSRGLHLPAAAAAAASSSGSESNDGNFGYFSNRRLGFKFGAILIGQAAFFLSLSDGSVLAQDDSVAPAATMSKQADAIVTGLRRIEDGSMISNEHTIKWRIFTDKAKAFFIKGKLDEAERFFKAALHQAKEGFGLRDPHAASALKNLAEFYVLRKEFEKAEPLFLEAIEILEQSFGPDDIRVGTALRNLGQHYHLQNRFDQAQTCYERALKIQGSVVGPGHPDYANTMYLLARVLSQQRKRKDAEALVRESIRILEEAGLGESPACLQRMMFHSTELMNLKQLDEAENLRRKILHIMELSKGWDSFGTTVAAVQLSVTLVTLGKLRESEELLQRCLAVRKKILSEDHIQVASILVHLAKLSLLRIISDIKVNNDLCRSHLVRGKRLVNDSIRIAEKILNPSREDQKKPKNAFGIELERRIAATGILLEALEIVGLLDCLNMAIQEWAPALIMKILNKLCASGFHFTMSLVHET
ncbi:kinesin light chain 3-like isoform X3 [Triticum urartu]|uniref:kinesin light chain 3-like isoform X3 n=1 Tax=Triticum urartu TaxID=4572 RepID=UPI0020447D98|nr:kinesin light chain 3-like isoform X3 [Triticum urartu]